MSPREKKLLTLFAAAGFLMLNFAGVRFYLNKRMQIERQRDQARVQLDQAEMFRASKEQVSDEMEWLAEHEPEPAANQDIQTTLQQLCEKEARAAGLEIKSQKPQPSETTGTHYHRAKIQLTVTGREEALYRWFDRLNMPDQLRMTTHIRLSPNTKDDTLIDCTATVEQWFVPLPPSA